MPKKKNGGNKNSYLKNVIKSITHATFDAVTDFTPSIRNDMEDNIKFAKEKFTMAKEKLTPGSVKKDNALSKMTKGLISNAMDDLRKGTIYNKKRENEARDRAINKAWFGEDDFDNDMSDLFGDEDTGGNTVNINNFMMDDSESTDVLSRGFESIANVTGTLLKTNNISFATVSKQLSIITNFQNENTIPFYNNMTEATDTINNSINNLNQQLTDLGGAVLASDFRYRDKTDNLFKMFVEGGLNFRNIQEVFKKKSGGGGGLGDIVSMFLLPELEAIKANPLGYLLKTGIKAVIPKDIKKSLSNMNSLWENIPYLIQGKAGKWKYSNNKILSTIGNFLDLNDRKKSSYKKYDYEKKAVKWDGISRRALVNTIPGYLSKILTEISSITGNSKNKNVLYDYESGKFINKQDAIREYKDYFDIYANTLDTEMEKFRNEVFRNAKNNGNLKEQDYENFMKKTEEALKRSIRKGKNIGTIDPKELSDNPFVAQYIKNTYKNLDSGRKGALNKEQLDQFISFKDTIADMVEDDLFQQIYDTRFFNKRKKKKTDKEKEKEAREKFNKILNSQQSAFKLGDWRESKGNKAMENFINKIYNGLDDESTFSFDNNLTFNAKANRTSRATNKPNLRRASSNGIKRKVNKKNKPNSPDEIALDIIDDSYYENENRNSRKNINIKNLGNNDEILLDIIDDIRDKNKKSFDRSKEILDVLVEIRDEVKQSKIENVTATTSPELLDSVSLIKENTDTMINQLDQINGNVMSILSAVVSGERFGDGYQTDNDNSNFFGRVWGRVKKGDFKNAFREVSREFSKIGRKAKVVGKKGLNKSKSKLSDIFNGVKDKFNTFRDFFTDERKESIKNKGKDIFGKIGEGLSNTGSTISDFLKTYGPKAFDLTGKGLGSLGNFLKNASVKSGKSLGKLGGMIAPILGKAGSALGKAGSFIGEKGFDFFKNVKGKASKIFKGGGSFSIFGSSLGKDKENSLHVYVEGGNLDGIREPIYVKQYMSEMNSSLEQRSLFGKNGIGSSGESSGNSAGKKTKDIVAEKLKKSLFDKNGDNEEKDNSLLDTVKEEAIEEGTEYLIEKYAPGAIEGIATAIGGSKAFKWLGKHTPLGKTKVYKKFSGKFGKKGAQEVGEQAAKSVGKKSWINKATNWVKGKYNKANDWFNKRMTREVGEEVGEQAFKKGAQEVGEQAAKTGRKKSWITKATDWAKGKYNKANDWLNNKFTREVGEEVTEKVAKESAEKVAKSTAKTASKEGAEQIAKATAKTATKEGGESLLKKGLKTAGKAGAILDLLFFAHDLASGYTDESTRELYNLSENENPTMVQKSTSSLTKGINGFLSIPDWLLQKVGINVLSEENIKGFIDSNQRKGIEDYAISLYNTGKNEKEIDEILTDIYGNMWKEYKTEANIKNIKDIEGIAKKKNNDLNIFEEGFQWLSKKVGHVFGLSDEEIGYYNDKKPEKKEEDKNKDKKKEENKEEKKSSWWENLKNGAKSLLGLPYEPNSETTDKNENKDKQDEINKNFAKDVKNGHLTSTPLTAGYEDLNKDTKKDNNTEQPSEVNINLKDSASSNAGLLDNIKTLLFRDNSNQNENSSQVQRQQYEQKYNHTQQVSQIDQVQSYPQQETEGTNQSGIGGFISKKINNSKNIVKGATKTIFDKAKFLAGKRERDAEREENTKYQLSVNKDELGSGLDSADPNVITSEYTKGIYHLLNDGDFPMTISNSGSLLQAALSIVIDYIKNKANGDGTSTGVTGGSGGTLGGKGRMQYAPRDTFEKIKSIIGESETSGDRAQVTNDPSDPGGQSFGTYQLTRNTGSYKKMLEAVAAGGYGSSKAQENAKKLLEVYPSEEQSKQAFQALMKGPDGDDFQQAQDAYWVQEYFENDFVEPFKKKYNFDLLTRSDGLIGGMMSIVNQWGPGLTGSGDGGRIRGGAGYFLKTALDTQGGPSASDEKLLNKIYQMIFSDGRFVNRYTREKKEFIPMTKSYTIAEGVKTKGASVGGGTMQFNGNVPQQVQIALQTAKAMIDAGYPYRLEGGATSPEYGAFDCSGLMLYSYGKAGINLLRTTQQQVKQGFGIPLAGPNHVDNALPGDLLFARPEAGGPGHVMMYAGNGMVYEAASTATGLVNRPVSKTSFQSQPVAIRRMVIINCHFME